MALGPPPAAAGHKAIADIETARALLQAAAALTPTHTAKSLGGEDPGALERGIDRMCDRLIGRLMLYFPSTRRSLPPDRVLP